MSKISSQRLTEWIKLRVKEMQELNSIRDGINKLTHSSQSTDVQQASKLLKKMILEKKLEIKSKIEEKRTILNMPNCGISHEPQDIFGKEDE